jgi:UDP-glucuronate 4-epimerase
MKKYLIVGGHGFIGSHLCKRLLEEDPECFDIYDIGEPNGDPSHETVLWRTSGLPDSITWEELATRQYLYCIHLGSYAGIRSGRDPLEYFRNNVLELQKFVKQACYGKLIYLSSSSVLGDVETAYSLSKKIAEEVVESRVRNNCDSNPFVVNPNSLIIRPFTVYGKYGRPEMVITKLVNGEDMKINGDPESIKRRYTFVEDLIDCILSNLSTTGKVNAIGGHVYKLSDLLEIFGNKYEVVDPCKYDFKNQTFNDNDKDYLCKTMIEDVKHALR